MIRCNIKSMKTRVSILLLLMLILTFYPSNVCADVIEPGMKEIKNYYKISNINDYSDYVFLIHGNPSPTYEIINSSKFSFYKLSQISIYAVKKSNFNEEDLKDKSDAEIQDYFKNNPEVIHSNLELDGLYGTVKIDNPLDSAVTILRIVSLNESELEIEKSKIIYVYKDGSLEEKIFKNQNDTPQPSPNTSPSFFAEFWYFILPVLAIAAIGLILVSRRLKK